MKSRGMTAVIATMIFAFLSLLQMPRASAQGYGDVSFDVFYDELSPYGNWDNDPSYGDIWYPNEGRNFRPYNTNGYWTMTEYGNTWVSGYDWGWAPFHYGRWVYNNYRGWGWVPGYEWGPAWVDWRSGGGYYGWAPMMPRVGVHVSIGLPLDIWVFAPVRNIFARDIYRYSNYGHRNIYNNTTIINNTYIVNNHKYYGGPSRRDMERTTGRKIDVRSVRQSDRPGSSRIDRNTVSIYRPDRDNNRVSGSRNENSNRRNGESVSIERNASRNDNRSNRSEANRGNISTNSNPRNSQNGRREMHIDKDGNVAMRNAESTSREQSQRQNIESRIQNQSQQDVRSQSRNQQRNTQRENSAQNRPSIESRQRTDRSMERQSVGRPEGITQQRSMESRQETRQSAPQIQRERSTPQRQERRTNQPVFQASTRVGSPANSEARSSNNRGGSSGNRGGGNGASSGRR